MEGWTRKATAWFGTPLGATGAARRARNLQFAQFGVLVALGLVAVLGVLMQSRAIDAAENRVLAAEASRIEIESLNNRVMRADRDFFRDRAAGGTGLTPDLRVFASIGPAIVRDTLERNVDRSADQAALERLVVADAERLGALISRFDDVRVGSTQEAALLAQTTPLVELQHARGDALVRLQTQATMEAIHDAKATSRRWSIYMVVLLGLLLVLGVVIWRSLSKAVGRMVGALERAADDLRERADRDQLTGLPGHAAFHEALTDAVAAAEAGKRALSLVLFDLDHFKLINDTYGHPVGDRVLREVAQLAREMARSGETIARVGGEEFAWLLPGADVHAAFRAAERLREAIAAGVISDVRLTISAGVSDRTSAATASELYRLADGALYWAKAHGRNITFRYSADVVEELSASDRAERLERMLAVNTVRALARAVDAKDPTTQRHSERVSDLARDIALELGWSAARATVLHEAGLVHDVGKIGVPDAILFKPGRLTPDEYAQVTPHSILGAQVVSGVLSDEQVAWVRAHHERVDGSGYPDGLAGDAIPEGARILALADAWDAMTSARPYSTPLTVDEALREATRHAGTQFWSPAVEALSALVVSGRLPHRADAGPRHAVASAELG